MDSSEPSLLILLSILCPLGGACMVFLPKASVYVTFVWTPQSLVYWFNNHNLENPQWLLRSSSCGEVRSVTSQDATQGLTALLMEVISGSHWFWIPPLCTFHHFYDKRDVIWVAFAESWLRNEFKAFHFRLLIKISVALYPDSTWQSIFFKTPNSVSIIFWA
jgi:hypothetical protein